MAVEDALAEAVLPHVRAVGTALKGETPDSVRASATRRRELEAKTTVPAQRADPFAPKVHLPGIQEMFRATETVRGVVDETTRIGTTEMTGEPHGPPGGEAL